MNSGDSHLRFVKIILLTFTHVHLLKVIPVDCMLACINVKQLFKPYVQKSLYLLFSMMLNRMKLKLSWHISLILAVMHNNRLCT